MHTDRGLLCKRALQKRRYFVKETYNLIEEISRMCTERIFRGWSPSNVTWLIHVCHDSSIRDMTHPYVTCLIYVQFDSFIWSIHVSRMYPLNTCQRSHMCLCVYLGLCVWEKKREREKKQETETKRERERERERVFTFAFLCMCVQERERMFTHMNERERMFALSVRTWFSGPPKKKTQKKIVIVNSWSRIESARIFVWHITLLTYHTFDISHFWHITLLTYHTFDISHF